MPRARDPQRISAADIRRWGKYIDLRNTAGLGVRKAADGSGVPIRSAYRFERGDQTSTGILVARHLGVDMLDGTLIPLPLDPVAQQALEDFELFRLIFTGRRSRPWQTRAAYDMVGWIESDAREYAIENMPPGSGKTTLFMHDIPAFLVARNRALRFLFGSRTESQARGYLRRIKNTLEREAPLRASPDDIDRDLAIDATMTMSIAYTAFKPPDRTDVWTQSQLSVRQLDGTTRDDKEPTFAAYGMDSGYLGTRVDYNAWDDLVDKKNTKIASTRDELEDKWDTEAETRTEPGGLCLQLGQRIAWNDLYRHNADKRLADGTPKYHHVVNKAHYDELCTGHAADEHLHPDETKAWPNGCLLDPYRLPWTGPEGLETIKLNNPRMYSVLYQQEDGDHVGGLVEPEWIYGGVDSTGYQAPGCLDHERAIGVVPEHLTSGRGLSFVTIDPSPAEFWGCLWTVYDRLTQTWYDVDIRNQRMNPGQLLDLDLDSGTWSGLLTDWHKAAIIQRAPIRFVIFEVNAAQRWALQQPHMQRWQQITGVQFMPHTTSTNKADPKLGVESLGEVYRAGRRRLPNATPSSRIAFEPMVTELLTYPDGNRDDLVMSAWFGKLAGHNLWAEPTQGTRFPRPDFVREAAMAGAYERGMPGWRI